MQVKNIFSKKAKEIAYPKIREIFDRANKFENVISLGIGEPDFDTDPMIINKAFELVKEKKSTHYTPVPGYKELREAIVTKYKEENKLKITMRKLL